MKIGGEGGSWFGSPRGIEYAPWTIIAGNDKRLARIQVLRAVNKALE